MLTKEEIKKKYKKYFTNCWDFSIGKGWLFLINQICYRVKMYENRLKDNLVLAKKYGQDEKSAWFGQEVLIKEELKQLKKYPFKWLQIKEKFGGGRFYYSGGNNEIAA